MGFLASTVQCCPGGGWFADGGFIINLGWFGFIFSLEVTWKHALSIVFLTISVPTSHAKQSLPFSSPPANFMNLHQDSWNFN